MDLLKQLRIEFKGVKATIIRYCDEGNVANFLDILESALEHRDLESMRYSVKELVNWYNHNLSEIRANQYVFNYDDHVRNKALLEKLIEELRGYEVIMEKNKEDVALTSKILLSHKSDDKKYGHAIRNLVYGLGLKNNQLIYSSHHLHKVPLDNNIFDYLRENIDSKLYVFFLWSDKYLDSPACMNEMGAAWITRSNYTNFFVPGFDYNNPKLQGCPVDVRQMGICLDGGSVCKSSMIELKNKLCKKYNLEIDEQAWTDLLDNFIKEIKES